MAPTPSHALTRRGLIAAAAATPLLAPAAAFAALTQEDHNTLARAAGYLQGLTEAKGRFVQTDPRGATSQGELFLKRPGLARFAYDAPSGLTVVSDGYAVSVADSRLKTFEKYPLSATPLSLFLARHIRFDQGVQVTRVTRLADGFQITARDARRQAEGQIQLTFQDRPLRLLGWTITDAQGQATRVRLTSLEPTSGLASSLFKMRDPRPTAPGQRGGR